MIAPTRRSHTFYDHNNDKCVVATAMLATGRYKAYVVEGVDEELDVRGYGMTRLGAIADLNAEIAKVK